MVWLMVFSAGVCFAAESEAAETKKDNAAEATAIETKSSNTININTATEEELVRLDGIGPAIAKRIIEHRKTYGSFEKPEDIMNVKGIGPKCWERNKDRISI